MAGQDDADLNRLGLRIAAADRELHLHVCALSALCASLVSSVPPQSSASNVSAVQRPGYTPRSSCDHPFAIIACRPV